jgi:hypothetical protein
MTVDTRYSELESEICKLSDSPEIPQALCALGLLQNQLEQFKLVQIEDWTRSGAETYSYVFQLHRNQETTKLILKACIVPAYGRTTGDILNGWLTRRNLVTSQGISTPRLYASGHGVILEEFIPFSLPMVINTHLIDNQFGIRLGVLAATLARYRFCPVAPFVDLRSRGKDVVMVDFGSDLGSPFQTSVNSMNDWIGQIQRMTNVPLCAPVEIVEIALAKFLMEVGLSKPIDI